MRLAIAIAALAITAAPASAAQGWRADGNAICIDYYDAVALFLGGQGDAPTPELLTGMARLTERKDGRLARLSPPASHAPRFASMLAHDRRGAAALREVAREMAHGGERIDTLLHRYDRETKASNRLARGLKLAACAGGGDAVTGPAEEL